MSDHAQDGKGANAWLIAGAGQGKSGFRYPQFAAKLDGERKVYAAVAEGDWLLLANASGAVTRVARVLRIRSDLT